MCVFSATEDKAIEICPTSKALKETGCQRASAYNGVFQSGTGVAEMAKFQFDLEYTVSPISTPVLNTFDT